MTSVTVRHNFETAHRLPQLGGKCTSLHGHSWWAEVTVTGPLTAQQQVVVDFGQLKHALRDWIDTHLDHGSMLGHQDPLVDPLDQAGCKVFVFGVEARTTGLDWPTVENVAELLHRVAVETLTNLDAPAATVTRVRVTETHCNAAEATP